MYSPVIGLEIHIELKTNTKMFCSCPNDFDEAKPNINVCPVCLGHPGTLPTINKEAVDFVLKLGLALSGKVAKYSHFDRKSYFYPDLPKGYQISQYENPLVSGGTLHRVCIRRIHLEEDTGRLLHSADKRGFDRRINADNISVNQRCDLRESTSLVDFNRAGVPLMELVTEPDIKSGEEAVKFAKELQRILRALKISDADMEKGQMRVEANVSLSDRRQATGDKKLGTKVEIKNLNSFRAVGEAIKYEVKRQTEILEKGEKIIQETRGWDDVRKQTVSQRTKEEAHDYRYFPEPDLPQLVFTDEYIDKIKASIQELPDAKRKRFGEEYELSDAQVSVLVDEPEIADYFEKSASELREKTKEANMQILLNYLTSDLKGIMNAEGISLLNLRVSPEHLAHLVFLIQEGKISSRIAKDLLLEMVKSGGDPETIMESGGSKFIESDEELKPIALEVIGENRKAVDSYRAGKENALQFLIGKAMAKTKGQASPEKLQKLIKNILDK